MNDGRTMLKKILGESKASGYELVCDLLNNARRRAVQKHMTMPCQAVSAIELLHRSGWKRYGYKTDIETGADI